MKRQNAFKRVLVSAFVLLLCLEYVSCDAAGADDRPLRDNTVVILSSAATEENVKSNSSARVDYSGKNLGFVNIAFTAGEAKVKVQIKKKGSSVTYTYNLVSDGSYETFPLSAGSGKYTVNVYTNTGGDYYVQALGVTFTADIKDENGVFLYPNKYINFSGDSTFVKLSEKLAADCHDELEVVESVYNYVVKNIKYDYNLVKNGVPTGYVPDIAKIMKTKKGICFDYASFMCALLRSQRIPAKLIVGYAGEEYHAWISVYIEEVGWVNNIIQFNGTEWVRMDPTYASTSNATKNSVAEHVGDNANYNEMYFY